MQDMNQTHNTTTSQIDPAVYAVVVADYIMEYEENKYIVDELKMNNPNFPNLLISKSDIKVAVKLANDEYMFKLHSGEVVHVNRYERDVTKRSYQVQVYDKNGGVSHDDDPRYLNYVDSRERVQAWIETLGPIVLTANTQYEAIAYMK